MDIFRRKIALLICITRPAFGQGLTPKNMNLEIIKIQKAGAYMIRLTQRKNEAYPKHGLIASYYQVQARPANFFCWIFGLWQPASENIMATNKAESVFQTICEAYENTRR
jgi:hypothetical protein